MSIDDILFSFVKICLGVIFYVTPVLGLLLLLTWLTM